MISQYRYRLKGESISAIPHEKNYAYVQKTPGLFMNNHHPGSRYLWCIGLYSTRALSMIEMDIDLYSY